jgi:hypothetical protein
MRIYRISRLIPHADSPGAVNRHRIWPKPLVLPSRTGLPPERHTRSLNEGMNFF